MNTPESPLTRVYSKPIDDNHLYVVDAAAILDPTNSTARAYVRREIVQLERSTQSESGEVTQTEIPLWNTCEDASSTQFSITFIQGAIRHAIDKSDRRIDNIRNEGVAEYVQRTTSDRFNTQNLYYQPERDMMRSNEGTQRAFRAATSEKTLMNVQAILNIDRKPPTCAPSPSSDLPQHDLQEQGFHHPVLT